MVFALENKLNWLYIDINSYFATIEQQVNPNLRYKPIAVVPLLSDSASVIAASHEAKLFGIKTGMKIYKARQLCPNLICIKTQHTLYVEYHHKIFTEIDKYLKVDHIFSIDEGACRLTGKYCIPEEAISIGLFIKNTLKDNVGDYINCSIGIAPNRYLAKIASNIQKPDGLVIIRPEELPAKLYQLKLKDLPGIGSRTLEKITNQGITNVKELCFLDSKQLKAIWGSIWGEKIWYLIRGADLPLEETQNSTIGHSQVLGPEVRNVGHARSILITLILKAAARLRDRNLYTNSILLVIDLMSKRTIKEKIKINLSCDNKNLLQPILKSWDNIIAEKKLQEVRKISISLHGLQQEAMQLNFDAFNIQKKQETLSKTIDSLNRKLGNNIISIGIAPDQFRTKKIIAFGHIPTKAEK